MYRAVSLEALRKGTSLSDVEGLATLSRSMDFEARDATAAEATDGRQYTVLLDGEDVSQALRTPQVEAIVSQVAAIPQVRAALVKRQQELAEQSGTIVMIGRDISSVVLPDADLKIYLDASAEVRAKRRNQQVGSNAGSGDQFKQFIEQRDRIDSQRAASPLVVVSGALVINTDDMDRQQVLEHIWKALQPKLE
jgi:cytidylate kinase